jgi:hypothetical protein
VFSPVFEQAGWIGRDAILMTGINSVIYVLSTIPTYVYISFQHPFSRLRYQLKGLPFPVLRSAGSLSIDSVVDPFFSPERSSSVSVFLPSTRHMF